MLQRIGLTYLLAAPLTRTTSLGQWRWCVALPVLHTGLLVVGGPLEPGHNVGVIVDRAVFGRHLLSSTGDPEGLLGLPTSVATALLGAATAYTITRSRDTRRAVWGLCVFGTALVVTGAAATVVIPLNKALWTASFTLVTGGISALCLAFCLLAPPWTARMLAPAAWLGTNPLAIYFLSELTTSALQQPLLTYGGHAAAVKDLIIWNVLVPLVGDGGGPLSSLAYALGYLGVWVGVAGLLHQRGIRLRV